MFMVFCSKWLFFILGAVQLCYSLNDALSQMVHLAIIAGLDCSHFNRYRCIKLEVLIVLFKTWRIRQVYNLAKTAGSCGLHFPLFKSRWHCSTWTHGKLCWKPRKSKPQKSKVISVLDIIKDMGKAEITSVQCSHKCHSIFILKKMLKAIKTFSIWTWTRHGRMMPHMSSAQDQGNLKDQSMRQPLVQYSELHVDEQIWKAASI